MYTSVESMNNRHLVSMQYYYYYYYGKMTADKALHLLWFCCPGDDKGFSAKGVITLVDRSRDKRNKANNTNDRKSVMLLPNQSSLYQKKPVRK